MRGREGEGGNIVWPGVNLILFAPEEGSTMNRVHLTNMYSVHSLPLQDK